MDDDLKKEIQSKVRIRIPGLTKGIAAGDVVKRLTGRMGIESCSECEKRRERMNRALRFEAWLKEEE